MGVFVDHNCESTLPWLIFGLKGKGCENVVFRHTMIVGKGWSADEERWIWVCSSPWCERGIMRRLCKNALRVF